MHVWVAVLIGVVGVWVIVRSDIYSLSTGEKRRHKFPPVHGVHPKRTIAFQVDKSQDHLSGFVQCNNQEIWWQCLRPKSGPSKATVVLFHGYADHSDYSVFEIASQIALRGNFTVIIFDQPGFGRSDGLWAYLPDWFGHVRTCVDASRSEDSATSEARRREVGPFCCYGSFHGRRIGDHCEHYGSYCV